MELHEISRILGTLMYGGAGEVLSAWKGLDDASRVEFLKVCKLEGTMPFVYRRLFESGLREGLKELEAQNVRQNVFAITNQLKIESLYSLLDGHGIRYAPIKGIDLAFRIYPSPSLRTFTDWDVLFPHEDINKAVRLLLDNGWEKDDYSIPEHFHTSILHKDGVSLEPHWMLPGFDGVTPEQIWRYVHPVMDGGCRHLLSPALNMLLLTRHASRGFYTVAPFTRMLLDAAYIMQSDGFDWISCREVSDALNLPCSADLLASFHEFFPEDIRKNMQADPERSEAFRKVFAQRKAMEPSSKRHNLVFVDANHFSLAWITEKVKTKCSPMNIRAIHDLPHEGQNAKVLAFMLLDLLKNGLHCIGFMFRRDSSVHDYAELIKKAEGVSK